MGAVEFLMSEIERRGLTVAVKDRQRMFKRYERDRRTLGKGAARECLKMELDCLLLAQEQPRPENNGSGI